MKGTNFWFVHCHACDVANRRTQRIFTLMVEMTWSTAEQAKLRKAAEMMGDD